MNKWILVAVLIGGLGFGAMPEAADAAQTRSKVKRSAEARPVTRRVATTENAGNRGEVIAGLVGVRDRSTYYLPNGRINGKEFFEQLQERSNGTGQ